MFILLYLRIHEWSLCGIFQLSGFSGESPPIQYYQLLAPCFLGESHKQHSCDPLYSTPFYSIHTPNHIFRTTEYLTSNSCNFRTPTTSLIYFISTSVTNPCIFHANFVLLIKTFNHCSPIFLKYFYFN